MTSANADVSQPLDAALVSRLKRRPRISVTPDGFRLAAADLVRRTLDSNRLPNRLDLRRLLGETKGPWDQFDDSFSDLIAAPHVAALCAEGRLEPNAGVVRRCREAWLFDADYFESVAPAALDALQTRPATRNLKASQ